MMCPYGVCVLSCLVSALAVSVFVDMVKPRNLAGLLRVLLALKEGMRQRVEMWLVLQACGCCFAGNEAA